MSQYANDPAYRSAPEPKPVWEDRGTLQVIFDGENYTECSYFATDEGGEPDYRVGIPLPEANLPAKHILECVVYALKDKFPTLEVKNVGIYTLIEKAKV